MKKFFLGSMALAAMIAGPAMAADMPVKVSRLRRWSYYDWSGAYVGFNIGGVWTDVDRLSIRRRFALAAAPAGTRTSAPATTT